jgi:hypothetical protein
VLRNDRVGLGDEAGAARQPSHQPGAERAAERAGREQRGRRAHRAGCQLRLGNRFQLVEQRVALGEAVAHHLGHRRVLPAAVAADGMDVEAAEHRQRPLDQALHVVLEHDVAVLADFDVGIDDRAAARQDADALDLAAHPREHLGAVGHRLPGGLRDLGHQAPAVRGAEAGSKRCMNTSRVKLSDGSVK